MLLMTSCVTSKPEGEIESRVIVETVYQVPDLDFPDFPYLYHADFDVEEKKVLLDLDFWMRLAGFKIDYNAVREEYRRIKEATEDED